MGESFMKKNRIQVLKNKRGKWFWRIRWSNSKIACMAEDYELKTNCTRVAKMLFEEITGTKVAKYAQEIETLSQTGKLWVYEELIK